MIKTRTGIKHSLTDDISQAILDAIPDVKDGMTAQELYDQIDQDKLTDDIVTIVQEHIDYGIQDLASDIAD
jgi:hypothetical protein